MVQALVRKSCPYSSDQLVEAANKGFTDRFKIKTRGTMHTVGPLSLQMQGFGKSMLEKRDLSWMDEE
jgi:hypothetical protein